MPLSGCGPGPVVIQHMLAQHITIARQSVSCIKQSKSEMTAETRPPIRISDRHCCVPTSTSSHIVHGFIVKRLDSWIAQSWEIMRTHFVPVAWTYGGGGQCN